MTAASSVSRATGTHDAPNHAVSGKCHAVARWAVSETCAANAYSSPRSTSAQSTTASTVASTKYACPWFEPKKRDERPPRRGCFAWRITISTRMPSSDAHPIASMAHSSGMKWPISGSEYVGFATCPYPVTRVRNSTGNDTMTTQWATLISGRCLNRSCPSTSRTSTPVRLPIGRARSGAGRPIRTVRTISRTPRAKIATPTTEPMTTRLIAITRRMSTRQR